MIKEIIEWADFEKIDIRTGTIIDAKVFEGLRKPAYQLWIDFGELGILKSSAQITVKYQVEDLKNKQIIAVVNFKPKQISTFMSECLVLGVYDETGAVILLSPDSNTQNGLSIG